MTTTTRNEAAERLRAMSHREVGGGVGDQIRVALDLALAAEHRATVERIRGLIEDEWRQFERPLDEQAIWTMDAVREVLDEEAAR